MDNLHFRFRLKPAKRQPNGEKYKKPFFQRFCFTLDYMLMGPGICRDNEEEYVYLLNLRDVEKPGPANKPEWIQSFKGNFHNPTIKNDFLFFEEYSGLGYTHPPEVCRVYLSEIRNRERKVVPEKFTPGTIIQLYGLPENFLAIKPKKKLIEVKRNRPLLIVPVLNGNVIHKTIENTIPVFDGDYITEDLNFICRLTCSDIENSPPQFEKINLQNSEKVNEIILKEIIVNKEDEFFPCNYSYGFSKFQGKNRYFIWQEDNLTIIDLDEFKKTSLVLPIKIPASNLQTERLCISSQNPFIYVIGFDGRLHIFDYQSYSLKPIEGLSLDPDFGFIVSPDDKWLAYIESNDHQEVLVILELKPDC